MENSAALFYQSATLMLVGMGFVFAFLSILIVAIKIFISPLASRYPDEVKAQTNTGSKTAHSISPPVIAAISAAISQHRNSGKNEQSNLEEIK